MLKLILSNVLRMHISEIKHHIPFTLTGITVSFHTKFLCQFYFISFVVE